MNRPATGVQQPPHQRQRRFIDAGRQRFGQSPIRNLQHRHDRRRRRRQLANELARDQRHIAGANDVPVIDPAGEQRFDPAERACMIAQIRNGLESLDCNFANNDHARAC
jgi:hypothetical protein